MRGIRLTCVFILLELNSITSWAVGPDFYGAWTDLFQSFKDPNTGLTIFPTLLIPMGGVTEGMGTASTAIARDSGFIESNPSASAILAQSELSFSHHGWIADSNLEGVVYTMRFNDLGIGIGGKFLYVPFTAYNEWGASGAKDYITETIATLNVSYNFFSSYYFYGVAVGSNIKVAYRSIPAVFAPGQSSLALMTDFGAQTSFNLLKFYSSRSRNFSVGAVIKNLGLSMLPGEALPLMATAGIAWSPLRPWLLACDFNLPFSLPGSPPAEQWNLAIGTTVSLTDFLSVQGGMLLKHDNPRLSIGTDLNLGTLNVTVNYNLDLSGQLNPLDKFSVQAKFNLGDSGRAQLQSKVDELYDQGLIEYSHGNYAKAIETWKQVLDIDPKYEPASDAIRVLEQTLAIQQALENQRNK